MVFFSFECFSKEVRLYYQEFFSFDFTIWINRELIGRNIKGKLYYPWFSVREKPQPTVVIPSDDPDDIPF
jgi:hypothetical protein